MFVDRLTPAAMHYPCNYGYIPHTILASWNSVRLLIGGPPPRWRGSTQAGPYRPVGRGASWHALRLGDKA